MSNSEIANLAKSDEIKRVLYRLHADLGASAFQLADHWDADLCAIGIARSDSPGTLVYISTFGQPEDTYFVSFELPAKPGDDFSYEAAGDQYGVTYERLLDIVANHLGCRRSSADPMS